MTATLTNLFETDSECIPRRLAAGLASEYKKTIPYVKIPCGLCRRVLHSKFFQSADRNISRNLL
jgi:cytidine deaminase